MAAQEKQQHEGDDNTNAEMLTLLRGMQQQMNTMQERITTMEGNQSNVKSATPGEPVQATGGAIANEAPQQATGQSEQRATPDSLRLNTAAVAEVAARLAEWGLAEEEQGATGTAAPPWRHRTRKSGTVTTSIDVIKHSIDWPHFHVRKGPTRSPPEYAQVSSEEFTVGFLRMLRAPESTFNKERMLEILLEVMEDAAKFGWENARAFYGVVGLEVEHKRIEWTDKQEILKLCLTHFRNAEVPAMLKTNRVVNMGNVKPCASYQTDTCDQNNDHAPFKHVCDYCFRVRNLTFHHPESECRTKRLHSPKNA